MNQNLDQCSRSRRYLLGGILVLRKLDHFACHLVDGFDNLQHLIVRDGAVLVYIVELKGP